MTRRDDRGLVHLDNGQPIVFAPPTDEIEARPDAPDELIDAVSLRLYRFVVTDPEDREHLSEILAAGVPVIERRVREQVAAEIAYLFIRDDEDRDALTPVLDYLKGTCHVCDEPLTAKPCTPRHSTLARIARGEAR